MRQIAGSPFQDSPLVSASLRCSFCGKDKSAVDKLIAGSNGVFICNECVRLCDEILEEELRPDG
ncbi:hypothetical protein FGL98_22035 [Leekyejoonella antrihumi]|uniref:ClpX-type ZB domain-containing protein n=1 Tax=Leekyejoonella antrihumi TaxID=1660198 RepID=A0A563DTF0_9MICO|nr:hypothetical protein FGL98_22035 [Leekyejoonella antrihumi]